MEQGLAIIVQRFYRFENEMHAVAHQLQLRIDEANREVATAALNASAVQSYKRMVARQNLYYNRQYGAYKACKNTAGVVSTEFDSQAHEIAFLREENAILREKCAILEKRAPKSAAAPDIAEFSTEAALPDAWGARFEAGIYDRYLECESARELINMSISRSQERQCATNEQNKALRDENLRMHAAVSALYARICEMQLALDRAQDEKRFNREE